MVTDEAAGELYVADGYLNRRIVVFDAKTGAYKRHWGAYGSKQPSDDKLPRLQPGSDHRPVEIFSNPVHCVRLSREVWSTSAIAPTTASRCSRRTAPS